MKAVVEMAWEAGIGDSHGHFIRNELPNLERFAELIRADERSSWPAEMEAMERQVNILTDALAQAKVDERERCAKAADEHMQECEGKHFGVGAAIRARSKT